MADVPFLDLRAAYLERRVELDAAAQRVLASGWYILGAEVEAFEREFAAYCAADHCVGVDEWNARRRAAAARYEDGLAGSEWGLPFVPDWAEPVWHLFVVRHPRRDELQRRLQQAGIGTMIHYPIPPHLQPAYVGLGYGAGAFPITEALHREVLSLPMGPHLTEAQQGRVLAAVKF